MATIQRELNDSGAPVPFGSGAAASSTSQLANIPKSADEAAMNADVRLRARLDIDNVQVPRADLSSMVFFERRRRDEEEKTYLLRTRIRDDPTIVQNKPFPLFPISYRLPMQCTRLACVPKKAAAPGDATEPLKLFPDTPASAPSSSAPAAGASAGSLPYLTGSKVSSRI